MLDSSFGSLNLLARGSLVSGMLMVMIFADSGPCQGSRFRF